MSHIAESKTYCWKCKKEVKVITLACHNVHIFDIDDDDKEILRREELGFSFTSNIEMLPKDLFNVIQEYSTNYKQGYTKTTNSTYFNNHCHNCSSIQGDFFLHDEPGGAFCPIEDDEIKRITLYKLDLIFDQIIRGSYSWSSNADDIIRLANIKK